jgi:hypothetical protein
MATNTDILSDARLEQLIDWAKSDIVTMQLQVARMESELERRKRIADNQRNHVN